jgi:NADH:ubiquinone oxidoreductase subunit F (NADH-binding)
VAELEQIASFYHLAGGLRSSAVCHGLACFAARHLEPERWRESCHREPSITCLGKCYAAPATSADPAPPVVEVRSARAVVLDRVASGGAPRLDEYVAKRGYAALVRALGTEPEQIVREVEASGLRGRGGAAFPAGRKWRAVRAAEAAERYVVANADEGDPGAYVDRMIVERDPHALIEAMAIAAHAVGASRGIVYLRCEYPDARRALERALDEARRHGFLGPQVLGSSLSFDVEIVVGEGSYVCGEESAMLRSIEGRRPEVASRPPYPTERGLWGRPTLVSNVETLVNIPWIVLEGGEAYHALGFSESRGTKAVSLNSLFRRPGLYEVDFGITVREIVEQIGGGLRTGTLRGVLIGGPLAGIIPPTLLDTRFGFEELRAIGAAVGHGGVIAFDEQTSIPELVHHVFAFGAFESCGKCTPCRLGTARLAKIFDATAGEWVTPRHRDEWRRIVAALAESSFCAMGTGLAEFAASVERYYGKELEAWFA